MLAPARESCRASLSNDSCRLIRSNSLAQNLQNTIVKEGRPSTARPQWHVFSLTCPPLACVSGKQLGYLGLDCPQAALHGRLADAAQQGGPVYH